MKIKYANNSTRWDIILFNYEDAVPQSTSSKVHVLSGNKGVVGISFSRSKASVQSAASIQIVGEPNIGYTIGNWIIIKSKVGKFNTKSEDNTFSEVSPLKEGVVRFIGQITTIENTYSVLPNGLLVKRATVHIREWSSVLNIPVRLDAFSFGKYYHEAQDVNAKVNLIKWALEDNNKKINVGELASELFEPFTSAALVLAIVGGLNTNKDTGIDANEALGKFAGLVNISKLQSRMPAVPKEMLEYLEMPESVTADQPFATGFANTLVGVMKPESAWSFPQAPISQQKASALSGYGAADKDKGAFNGYFESYNLLKTFFKNYKDRPLSNNFLNSLSQGLSAWSLIQQQLDMTINEAFTDIWYFKTESGATTSLPMIVLRDKPFALKSLLENPENPIKETNWTAFDEVPRIFVDDVFIQNVSTTNSFFTSPNYIEPQFQTGEVGSVRSDSASATYARAVHRIIDNPAIERFGTIEYFWNTVYSAPVKADKGNVLYVNWFDDVKKLMYYWHSLSYRFGEASLTLKDNDLPIMVGCNISFPMGENVLCGQVESVSWNFSIGMDGLASTTTSVKLSYLCRVKDDGSLGLIGPVGFTNLMSKELVNQGTDSILSLPNTGEENLSTIKDPLSLIPKLNLPKLPKVPF